MTTDTPAFAIPTLEVTTIPALTALCFSTRATLPMLPQLGHVAGQLYDQAARLGLVITGPVQYVYEGATGDPTNEFGLTIALPIQEQEPGTLPDGFVFQTLPAFRCTSYTHTGAWATLPPMYDALFPAFYAQRHTASGLLREVYAVIDREQPDRCVTEIQIGCN